MPGSSSWMPYAPQGAKGIDDDDVTILLRKFWEVQICTNYSNKDHG